MADNANKYDISNSEYLQGFTWFYDVNNHIMTKSASALGAISNKIWLYLKKGSTISVNTNDLMYKVYEYDLDKVPKFTTNPSPWSKIGTVYTAGSDCYVLWSCGTSGSTAITPEQVFNGLEIIIPIIGTEIAREIPSYWDEELTTSINSIKGYQTGVNVDSFGFITDTHMGLNKVDGTNAGYSPALLEKILTECDIPVYLDGADFVEGKGVSSKALHLEEIATYKEMFKNIEPYCLRTEGNHDAVYGVTTNNDSQLTPYEVYNYLFRGNSKKPIIKPSDDGRYFYADIPQSKIRYIVVSVEDFAQEEGKISARISTHKVSATQIAWLKNTALVMPSADWACVILSHVAPWVSADCPWAANTSFITNATALTDMMNAFINKTGDFTDSKYVGECICWIAGHDHNDYHLKKGKLNIVITANDSLSVSSLGYAPTKTIRTATEQLFDVFTVNRKSKNVNITRVGAGDDRYFNYRYIVADTFSRQDSSTLGTAETGQTWEVLSGTFTVKDYKALKTFGGSGADSAVIDSTIADGIVSADGTWTTSNSCGVIVRCTNVTNFIQAVIDSTGLTLKKYVDGVATTLGTPYTFTPVTGTTYNVKVTLNGSAISVSLNGTERITATDSFNATATKHGMRVPTNTATPASTVDNFFVEPL